MALVISPPSTSSAINPTAALTTALAQFENALTEDQKQQYRTASVRPVASDVIAFVVQLDSNNHNRARRCFASRLCTFLDRTQQFVKVVDTFISARPETAALVWGGIKLAIVTASNVATYFDKVTSMIMDVSRLCPVYEQFGQLFTGSIELQRALCEYYAIVIRLCMKIIEIVQRSAVTQFFSSVWNPFDSEFKPFRDKFDEAMKDVSISISLASKQAAVEAAKISALERDDNRKRWSTLFASSSEMKQEREDARQWRLHHAERQKSALRSRIRDNLSTINYLQVWKHIHQQKAFGTGKWLQKESSFLKWKESANTSILWCPGILGVGKTVLLSHIIGYLQQTRASKDIICHHFCRFEDSASLSARAVLGTITRQMLDIQIENLGLAELISLGDLTRDIEVEDLVNLMLPHVKPGVTYYIIIDGLDEMQRNDLKKVVTSIAKLCDDVPKNIKILLAGKPELGDVLFRDKLYDQKITISKSATMEDMECFSVDILDQHLEDGSLVLNDPKLILQIMEALKQNSEGIFLWTRLFIEELCAQQSDNEILKALDNPPRKISQLIDQKLVRVKKHDAAKHAVRLLRYCGYLRRPLKIDEHRELLAIRFDQVELDIGSLPSNMDEIIAACCGLVFVDEEQNTVHYIHDSIRQHIITSRIRSDGVPQDNELDIYLGKLCLTYLNFSNFHRQMVRQKPSSTTTLSPIQFGITSVSQSSDTVAKTARTFLKFRRQYKTLSSSEIERKARDILGDRELTQPQDQQFSFLRYARSHWIHHLQHLDAEYESRMWRLFCNCMEDRASLAEKPWAKRPENQDTSAINLNEATSMCQWCVENAHYALLLYVALHHPKAVEEHTIRSGLCSTTVSPHHHSVSIVFTHVISADETAYQGLGHALDNKCNGCLDAYSEPRYFTAPHLLTVLAQRVPDMASLGHLGILQTVLAVGADVDSATDSGSTALYIAAKNGHIQVVEKLLGAGAKVNVAPGHGGYTALYAAAQEGHNQIVEMLLAAGTKVDLTMKEGWTALHIAAEKGNNQVVEMLLRASAGVNLTREVEGRRAIHIAAAQGYIQVVEILLANGAKVDLTTTQGHTALHLACQNGHIQVVGILLATGAKVDFTTKRRLTALHLACQNGHIQAVEKLLGAGADVNRITKRGYTALYIAAQNGHIQVVEILLATGAKVDLSTEDRGRRAIHIAAQNGHIQVVEKLLAASARVDLATKWGYTALYIAAENSHIQLVEILLAAGAEVNRTTEDAGYTALHRAAEKGHNLVVEILLAAGAKVDLTTEYRGYTALYIAAENGHIQVVEILLVAGAKVDLIIKRGHTALYIAAQMGHNQVVEKLLAASARVDLATKRGYTALYIAAENGHIQVVEILLVAGAKVDLATKRRYTALHIAAEKGHQHIVERLLAAGADIGTPNDTGETPLMLARKRGHSAIVDMLNSHGVE